ncbi:MAG: sterol desaturase family protein [Thermoanaerobaculia bacterium]
MQLTSAEAAAFVAVGGAAVLLALLERRYPYNAGQPFFRTGFVTDFVWYNAVQSCVLGLFIGRLIRAVDGATGVSRLGLLSNWPVPLALAFFLVTHDLYIYLFHRRQHYSPFLWRFHEAHHSVPQVDWLSGVRSHPVEILVNQTIEFAPIVLLAAAPDVALWKGAMSAIWGMFIHSNLDVRLGRLQRLVNGPEMHRWHHALDAESHWRNFATKLALWDWLFRTAFLPDPDVRKATRYGLSDPDFPEGGPVDGWARQVVWAFRPGPPRAAGAA